MTNALILGKGGFGIQLSELLLSAGVCDRVAFLDDNAPGCAGRLRDFSVPALLSQYPSAFVGLGNNALRVELLSQLAAFGYHTPVFIHPSAVVCPSAVLGPGTVVLPFAYVGAGVRTGAGCLINAGAIVDHNVSLGAGVHMAPGSIAKAGATIPQHTKVESGEIIHSPW